MHKIVNLIRHNSSSIKILTSLSQLQLKQPTTQKQIKKSYLSMVKEYHPDRQRSQETPTQEQKARDKFIEVTEAYKHLSELQQDIINSAREDKVDRDEEEEEEQQRFRESYQKRKTDQYFDGYGGGVKEEQKNFYEQYKFIIGGVILGLAFSWDWILEAKAKTNKSYRETLIDQESNISIDAFNYKKKYTNNDCPSTKR